MGMFDELRCKYPLPVPGANDLLFQTKSLDCAFMDLYEIREDGTLWHEAYDIEDHSDPKAEGIERIFGMATRVNKRWEQLPHFTGEIRFYISLGEQHTGWIEFSSYFVQGKIQSMNLIKHEKPEQKGPA